MVREREGILRKKEEKEKEKEKRELNFYLERKDDDK